MGTKVSRVRVGVVRQEVGLKLVHGPALLVLPARDRFATGNSAMAAAAAPDAGGYSASSIESSFILMR
eukprot:m.279395 g.279395  ORF g.279395 m.279395 type:complete len:68 (-) comp26962_c0_seq1:926-1129(-)